MLALSFRNKLNFLDGTITKLNSKDSLFGAWIRYNNLILARPLESISPLIAFIVVYMDLTTDV